MRELNFEVCPGENRCSTKETGRIYQILKGDPEREIELICGDCRFRETKPGREPEHLSHAIWIAQQLDEDHIVCGGFDYPAILDYLDPLEWACLVAIKGARQASESKAARQPQEEAQKQAHKQAQVAHLKRLAHS